MGILKKTKLLWTMLVAFAMIGFYAGISVAHPGGAPPPVHPPVHPEGAANIGMMHMSPTAANFGTGVAAIANTQGKTISQDARSGITGQTLSNTAKEHGDAVSDVATGTTNPGTPSPDNSSSTP